MLVITDEDVPDSIANFLTSRGHEVWLTRDRFLPSTPDRVIATAASKHGAVVATWNKRHFRALAKRRRKSGALSYPGMSVIVFRCGHSDGLSRLTKLIEEIEAVYGIRVESAKQRMIVEVTDSVLRIED